MIKIDGEDLQQYFRRIEVAQTCVWAASEHLQECGDKHTSAGLSYAFEDLFDLLERCREEGPPRK